MIPYSIWKIEAKVAKEYISKHHYSRGSHNGPSPCYGLFDRNQLIGVLMFATPCGENVRSSVFGSEYKNHVTELHRLHILDVTPKNTESWFIARCLRILKQDKPHIWAVISFSDTTVGHTGVIYRATNARFIGSTEKKWFYEDDAGRLRHPRQNGINISPEMAEELRWKRVQRESKNRYLWLLPDDRRHRRELIRMCKY